MTVTANVVWDDYNITGIAASGKKKVKKSEAREWGTFVEGAEDRVTSALADAVAIIDDRIDLIESGSIPRASVRVATTANGALATAFDNGSVIDGVTLVTNDEILIKDQSAPAENGVYVVAASGAPTRRSDMNAASEFPLSTVYVRLGTENSGSTFKCSNVDPVTVGTDPVNFVLISEVPSTLDEMRNRSSIASAATTDLSSVEADYVTVTGTTTITSFGTLPSGAERTLVFVSSLKIVHDDTSMILLGGCDRITEFKAVMTLRSMGSGNWREISYSQFQASEKAPAETRSILYAGPGGDVCDLLEQTRDPEVSTGTIIEETVLRHLDEEMWSVSGALFNRVMSGVASFRTGMNVDLGVGQSFMASSDNAARIRLTPWSGYQLNGVTYNARMIGTSDRCKSSGATYDYFGTLALNPLIDTVVSGSTGAAVVVSQADVESGNYTTSARGATPLPNAIINFEKMWCNWIGVEVDSTRFPVAVNVAKGEAGIEDIGAGDSLARMEDGIDQADAACDVTEPSVTLRQVSCVFERHGQFDEQYANTITGVTPAEYKTLHRQYRADVLAKANAVFGQTLPPLWIGTQVSGSRGYPGAPIATVQLEMSMNKAFGALDIDYILACPDYPFPNFQNAAPSHPNAEDDHPTTNGNYMAADYMAAARFTRQVLKKNWFLTQMRKAYFYGRYIYVGFISMVPPIRVRDVCVGTTMTEITVGGVTTYGFTVYDGTEQTIMSVELIGDNVFRIECGSDLASPTVWVAEGDRLNWPDKLGASNICDSANVHTLFPKEFIDGYTNKYAGMYDDTLDLENITEILGKQDMGNWAAVQSLACLPLPTEYIA